jgi:thiol-disulfide isomerase/thioredoxin
MQPNYPQSKACLKKGSGTVAGTVRRLLCKTLPNPSLSHAQFIARLAIAVCLVGFVTHLAKAASPTAAQALKLAPIQRDNVDYEIPDADATEKCTIKGETANGQVGWIVRNGAGQLLRRFLDTNGDNKVDRWCYYKDGVEVYRDIDADFNGKADQYRWLGMAGIRWGLDKDEDNHIDAWKVISPEEVSAEVVAALRNRDMRRFEALLPTKDELSTLGLGVERRRDLERKLRDAVSEFVNLARRQKVVSQSSQWVHFGGTQPGVVPEGTDGATKDIYVYENVAALIETDGNHRQIGIGTLVKVGDGWRIIDLPTNLFEGEVASHNNGFFFHAAFSQRPDAGGPADSVHQELQNLIADLERVDNQLASATEPPLLASLNAKRADTLQSLVSATGDPKERGMWIHQFADTISAAVQSDQFPQGVERLRQMYVKLQATPADREHVAYVKFRYLTADYAQKMQDPNADFVKIQEKWLSDLKSFVASHPATDDAAEAMLQLAIALEFAGEEQQAMTWYTKISKDFPDNVAAKKASGAKRRLESVGKSLSLRGRSTNGQTVDLSNYRGHVVLIHYWATWCEPCKQDIEELKKLQAKYATKKFSPIGVSLDSDASDLSNYLKQNRLPWPQLFEPGGLDSPLADELGILSLPTMILIDTQGRVVSRNIHVSELDAELKKLLP